MGLVLQANKRDHPHAIPMEQIRTMAESMGLRVGMVESAFNTFIGYAGNVINDTLVPYGDFDTNVIQYYFDAGNGFSAVVSLEEGSGSGTPGFYGVGSIDSYVPHVVGGVKWTLGRHQRRRCL